MLKRELESSKKTKESLYLEEEEDRRKRSNVLLGPVFSYGL